MGIMLKNYGQNILKNKLNMAKIIKSSGEIIEVEPKNGKDFSLEEMQKIVDGYIQIVTIGSGQYMVCNEEGLIHDLPVNLEASKLYYGMIAMLNGHYICGDVLICEPNQVK